MGNMDALRSKLACERLGHGTYAELAHCEGSQSRAALERRRGTYDSLLALKRFLELHFPTGEDERGRVLPFRLVLGTHERQHRARKVVCAVYGRIQTREKLFTTLLEKRLSGECARDIVDGRRDLNIGAELRLDLAHGGIHARRVGRVRRYADRRSSFMIDSLYKRIEGAPRTGKKNDGVGLCEPAGDCAASSRANASDNSN